MLEVLVAVTLLSIAAGAVYANFSIGLNSYKKGTRRGEITQEARGGLRVLQSDLEHMSGNSGETGTFAKQQFSFQVLTEQEKSRTQQVTYTLSGAELKRSSAPAGGTAGESSEFSLVRGISSAEFEYHNGAEWVPDIAEKGGKTVTPVAVRIKLGIAADGEEGFFQTAYLFPVTHKSDEKKKGK